MIKLTKVVLIRLGFLAASFGIVASYMSINSRDPVNNQQNNKNIESIVRQEEIESNNSEETEYVPQEITYTEMGEPGGITLIKETKLKDVETLNAKFYLGDYNIKKGLTKDEYYSKIKDLPKRIELEALLDLSKGQRFLGALFMKEPVEQYIKRKDIIDDFLKISKSFEEFEGYAPEDTMNLKRFFNEKGVVRDEYPKGSILSIDTEGNIVNDIINPENEISTNYPSSVKDKNLVLAFDKFLKYRIKQKNITPKRQRSYLDEWYEDYVKKTSKTTK